jgi:hypothetical protein
MFVLVGFGNEQKRDYGAAVPVTCPNCHNQTYLHLVEVKKRFSLFFVPLFPYDSDYYLLCTVCSRGVELDEEQFEKAKKLCRATRAFREGRISEDEYNAILNRSHLARRFSPKLIEHPGNE